MERRKLLWALLVLLGLGDVVWTFFWYGTWRGADCSDAEGLCRMGQDGLILIWLIAQPIFVLLMLSVGLTLIGHRDGDSS